MNKSTPEEIRARFDNDVERFSNLETGQATVTDSALLLDLVSSAAAALHPAAETLLDVGCGAGNYTLKMLQKLPTIRQISLIDLSRPMLDRAIERIEAAVGIKPAAIQGDVREVNLGDEQFDVIVAAAVLHHLRTPREWEAVFAALKAAAAGVTVVCTLHSNSERAMLKRLAEKLREKAPQLAVSISQQDRDPFSIA